MAELIFAAALSHSPLLVMEGATWAERAAQDKENKTLNLSDGRSVSYDALLAEVGPRYAHVATDDEFERQSAICERSLDRLGDELIAARPDIVLLIGDDHQELFTAENQPAISVFYGDEVVTRAEVLPDTTPDWIRKVYAGFAMDRAHSMAGHSRFARHLIQRLLDHDVDVAVSSGISNPEVAGLGHAVGFVVARLFKGNPIPVVPLLVNTYYPPNVPSARRCHDIGAKLSAIIDDYDADVRVAVIASGGLSHFVTDEVLDRRVLEGLNPGKADLLRTIPAEALREGSSEILCWVMLAGAVDRLPLGWIEYQPIYRTPAGTGIGMGFARWGGEPSVTDAAALAHALEPQR